MKNHTTVLSRFAEHSKKLKITQGCLNTNSDFKQLGNVTTAKEFGEIMRESRKSCPGPDKICYRLLKRKMHNVKAMACILFFSFFSSINNSVVPVNWNELEIKIIAKQDQDQLHAENYLIICLLNCVVKICKIVLTNRFIELCESQKYWAGLRALKEHTASQQINLLEYIFHYFPF